MEQDLQKQVEKRLTELPQDVREAIQSAQVQEHLRQIAQKHKLHIDQGAKLEDEVYMVMLGFADPAELSQNLAEGLSLPVAEAVVVATDVTNEIFMPIRASMQRWAEEHGSAHAEKPAPAPIEKTPIPTPPPAPITTPKPAPDLAAADAVLSEKKVSVPTPAQPAAPETMPQNYKADPYREPIE